MEPAGHFSEPAPLRFEFRGSAGEYFKIWLANIVLSILTLGIYSAWAKVRTTRYFYASTFLHGANFEYHAKPLSILIARLVVLAVIVGGGYFAEINPLAAALYSPALLLFLPWAWVRGLSFNARNSSYRGVRFSFRRAYKIPFAYYASFVFLIPGVLFLPFLARRYHKFKAERHALGKLRFGFAMPPVGGYLFIFWGIPLLFIAAAAADFVTGFVAGLFASDFRAEVAGNLSVEAYLYALFFPALMIIVYARARMFLLFWQNVRGENGAAFACDFTAAEFAYKILLVNFFAVIFSLGLLTPWAHVRKTKFLAARMHVFVAPEILDQIAARRAEDENAIGEEFDASEGFDFDVGLI